MADFEKVTDDVFLVGGARLSHSSDCMVYAVDLGDLVLIDCGAGSSWRSIRANLGAAGLKPDKLHTLVLTHGHVDHIGAAAQIQAQTGCQVVAHAGDAPAIESADPTFTVSDLYAVDLKPVKLDRIFQGGQETLSFSRGELLVVHTPGHTPGSVAVVRDTGDTRILFGQDIHGPFSQDFDSDIQAWRASMHRLLDLDADILCEGHFGVFRPAAEVRRFIQEQLASSEC